jgi:predicted transcriptional regulator
MNKTTIKVLQEIIRNKEFSVESTAKTLNKAKTTIYDSLAKLRKNYLLNKKNQLTNNEVTQAYKKLFLSFPYDFSFLTKNNLVILQLLEDDISFTKIIKLSKKSRFTVHQLLKQLRTRGFINKKNRFLFSELLDLLKIIKKYNNNHLIELPSTAVIIQQNEERNLIQATKETVLPLRKTAFSVMDVVSPYNYYTSKKRVTENDIFMDAKILAKTKREEFITALFYKRKKLKRDMQYEQLIKLKEFKDFENGV